MREREKGVRGREVAATREPYLATFPEEVRESFCAFEFSYPRAATEITPHALSSPQLGSILSVTSYLREWVSRLAS